MAAKITTQPQPSPAPSSTPGAPKIVELVTQNLSRQSNATVTYELIVPKSRVESQYKKTLDRAVEKTEIKGFRKGKAPEKLVEERIGKKKLSREVLETVVAQAYVESLEKLNLKPVIAPKIEAKEVEEGNDWKFTITLAEKPPIALGEYKQAVSAALAKHKIWVPGKDDSTGAPTSATGEPNPKPQDSIEEKMATVLETLLAMVKIDLAPLLIDEEQQRLLAQLVQKLERLNLSIEEYLRQIGKTTEQLQTEYREQAQYNLKLELALHEIANDLSISVDDQEVDRLIQVVGDENLRKELNSPSERAAIKGSLRKRKALDALLKL